MTRAIVIALFAGSAAAQPSFQGIGDIPGGSFDSSARGVSANGIYVTGKGNSFRNFSFSQDPAFVWSETDGILNIGDLAGGGIFAEGRDVSNNRRVCGVSDAGFDFTAFRWDTTVGMLLIDDIALQGLRTTADGISANGQYIAGSTRFGSDTIPFRLNTTAAGSMELLGDLPGGGTGGTALGISSSGDHICGAGTSANGGEAFRWTSGGGLQPLGDLPGGAFGSGALGISGSGAFVCGTSTSANGSEAFLWSEAGGMIGLGDLAGGGFTSQANDVANNMTVVGRATDANTADGSDAFIWDPVNGMRNLETVLTGMGINLAGWTLFEATAISDSGMTIVGIGSSPNGNEGWIARLGPEPTACPADINDDGSATPADFTAWLGCFNDPGSQAFCVNADVNGSGMIDPADFTAWLAAFNAGCP